MSRIWCPTESGLIQRLVIDDDCKPSVEDSSSVLRQEIGWEERLGNDLFYVDWDVKPSLDVKVDELVAPFVSTFLRRCEL